MKKYLLVMAIFVLIPTVSSSAVREDSDVEIKKAEKFYNVTYQNGGTDRFVYVFSAHLTSFMKQDGESSSWKHPTDSRRCSYTVSSYILREGYFVTGGGQRIPLESVKKVYGPGEWRRRTNNIVENVLGQHSPCNDYINDFNNIKESTKKSILKDFDTLFLQDVIPQSETDAKKAIKSIKAFAPN